MIFFFFCSLVSRIMSLLILSDPGRAPSIDGWVSQRGYTIYLPISNQKVPSHLVIGNWDKVKGKYARILSWMLLSTTIFSFRCYLHLIRGINHQGQGANATAIIALVKSLIPLFQSYALNKFLVPFSCWFPDLFPVSTMQFSTCQSIIILCTPFVCQSDFDQYLGTFS